MENFQNKTALVIGGTSGIGYATTLALLEGGATVHIAGRNTDKVADAANLVKHTVNISDSSSLNNFISEIEGLNNLDYLVNASGIFGPKPFLDHTVEDYNSYLDLNRGFFFLTQSAAKKMKATGGGSIVNVGSMWAKQAVKATPSSAYSMQKAGLHSLTQHLAMELADDKIRVNAVSPAVVETPVYHGVFGGKEEAEKAKKEAAEQIAAAEKAAEEKAASALKAKEEAEAAAAAAEKAKADAIKAKEEAEQALEDALADGGGSEALQKEADRKAKLAEEAAAAADARARGLHVVGIELADDAVPITNLALDGPTCLVLGHEDRGISPATLGECDTVAYLPQLGKIGSLNLATAASIALWEVRRRGWTETDE